jgi:hypothetical protein
VTVRVSFRVSFKDGCETESSKKVADPIHHLISR